MPSLSITNEQILKIKFLGEGGARIVDICNDTGLSVSVVGRHFHKFFPAKKKSPDWSAEEIEHLETLIKEGLSHEKVGQILKRTRMGIRVKAHQMGFKSQFDRAIYSYDKTFWNEPNPINCALAGFIAADGCVSVTGTSKILSVSLSRIDDGYLKMLAHFWGANHPIRYSVAPHGSKMADLRIAGNDWIEPLADIYNIIPAKTHKLKLPNIPPHLMDHYFKGFTDGD